MRYLVMSTGKLALNLRREDRMFMPDTTLYELSTNLYSITDEGAAYIMEHCPDWEKYISMITVTATTVVSKQMLENAMVKQDVLKATVAKMAQHLATEIMKRVEPTVSEMH